MVDLQRFVFTNGSGQAGFYGSFFGIFYENEKSIFR
jgi:hypothetical protein